MKGVGKPKRWRGDGNGIVWPDSGNATVSDIKDVFGPRDFPAHIATVGYDYDFHRGADVGNAAVYSPVCGSVNRLHRTHFGFEADSQLNYLEAVGTLAHERVTGDLLRMTGVRAGATTFPATAPYLRPTIERLVPSDDTDWVVELRVPADLSLNGAVGFGIHDPLTGEYCVLEYDGSDFTAHGDDGAAMTGGSASAAAQTWMRIEADVSANTITWQYGTDGDSWTVIATETGVAFTNELLPVFEPVLYYRADDVGTSEDVDVAAFQWVDDNTVGRFGNWLTIVDSNSQRWLLLHFQELDVALGQQLQAGSALGTAGLTGFDARSGRINTPHNHIELIPVQGYFYDNDEPINPLGAGGLPHANTDANVAVVRTNENDPDAVDSWKLAITVTRADQDFDLNTITLTGDVASRTVNFNTRAGLNADNDVPLEAGVYIVPQSFNGESASYQVDVFFHRSVVGTTFTSAEVRDTAGTLLWSE